MNILFIKYFFVGFMVSKIPRVSVFSYFPLHIQIYVLYYSYNLYILIIFILKFTTFKVDTCTTTLNINIITGFIIM